MAVVARVLRARLVGSALGHADGSGEWARYTKPGDAELRTVMASLESALGEAGG